MGLKRKGVKVRWGSTSAESGCPALVHIEDGRCHLHKLLRVKLILKERTLGHIEIGASKVRV
jgi:hypothetical protein